MSWFLRFCKSLVYVIVILVISDVFCIVGVRLLLEASGIDSILECSLAWLVYLLALAGYQFIELTSSNDVEFLSESLSI
jgi:hypothetical protein